MKKVFKRYMPDPKAMSEKPLFRVLGNTLLHPSLWHVNRRSAAGGVATGLFCGLIPGPLQMLGSAIICLVGKFNLPIALLTTFYTNPFTILPLYVVGYGIGSFVLGNGGKFVPPPQMSELSWLDWIGELGNWFIGLGKPLALGLFILALALAAIGYVLVMWGWRWHVIRELKRRKARHAKKGIAHQNKT